MSNKKYYDKSAMAPKIAVGAQVYIKCHRAEGPNTTGSPKFKGPYRVVKILPLNKFEPVDERSMKLTVRHWNELKFTTSDLWNKSKLSLQDDESDNGESVGTTPARKCVYNLRPRSLERNYLVLPW